MMLLYVKEAKRLIQGGQKYSDSERLHYLYWE